MKILYSILASALVTTAALDSAHANRWQPQMDAAHRGHPIGAWHTGRHHRR